MGSVSTDGHVDLGKSIERSQAGNYTVFQNGDIIFAKITPCMENGKMAIVDNLLNGYGAGSTEFIVLRPNKDVLSAQWLYFFLSQTPFRLQCQQHMTGSAGQKRVPPKYLASCSVPVPPLPEQERIVAKIEELFSELDNGVETLKKTNQQLAVYRQAVLKAAFEGQLTCSIPQAMGRLGSYIEPPRYGTAKKCNAETKADSIPVYRIPNINHRSGHISHADIKFAQFTARELDGIRLKQGDILIIRSNGSASLVGRAAMVGELDTDGTFAGYLMRLRIRKPDKMLPKFVLLYLQSHQARSYIENNAKSTSGVHNINANEIANLPIPLFDSTKQFAIIEAAESRLSVCDSIEKTVDAALQQAEAMRQSILKKAFEGGL